MKTVCIFLGENTLYRMDFFVRPYGCFCDFLQRTLQSWSTFLTKSSKIFSSMALSFRIFREILCLQLDKNQIFQSPPNKTLSLI